MEPSFLNWKCVETTDLLKPLTGQPGKQDIVTSIIYTLCGNHLWLIVVGELVITWLFGNRGWLLWYVNSFGVQ